MPSKTTRGKRELWLRLHHYHFDDLVPSHLMDHVSAAFGGADASSKAFANKLGRKLGWSTPFALRAIEEYKRFVFLGIVSDFYVTPAKAIDQVWHEHLLFTRGYRDFCKGILRQEFDHAPELVPTNDQTNAFQAQYEATLDLYRKEFNAPPPSDIWGRTKFDAARARDASKELRKRERDGAYSDDTPVHAMFSGDSAASASDAGFGGGGGFSGGGSSGSFGEQAGTDSSGSDSGASDGGGSGCSSGCGGGGGD